MNVEKAIIDTLISKYRKAGYVLNDDILELCIDKGIGPARADYICKKLNSEGVLITDKVVEQNIIGSNSQKETTLYTDFSQTDYESIYDDILELYPGMKSIIDEIYYI